MDGNLILLARAVANESEQRGFPHTAEAMRQVIAEMIADQEKSDKLYRLLLERKSPTNT
jgi:hypothetical protein